MFIQLDYTFHADPFFKKAANVKHKSLFLYFCFEASHEEYLAHRHGVPVALGPGQRWKNWRQVEVEFGFPKSSCHRWAKQLEKAGLIRLENHVNPTEKVGKPWDSKSEKVGRQGGTAFFVVTILKHLRIKDVVEKVGTPPWDSKSEKLGHDPDHLDPELGFLASEKGEKQAEQLGGKNVIDASSRFPGAVVVSGGKSKPKAKPVNPTVPTQLELDTSVVPDEALREKHPALSAVYERVRSRFSKVEDLPGNPA